MYPPGSTFKILTVLEYIRENPDTYEDYQFQCTGKFTKENYTIRCFHNTNHGTVDLKKAFAKSCNSAFANIGLEIDRKNLIGHFIVCISTEIFLWIFLQRAAIFPIRLRRMMV